MTDNENVAALEAHRDEIERLIREVGDQAGIDYANSLIDASAGIVGGDGVYRPRANFPE